MGSLTTVSQLSAAPLDGDSRPRLSLEQAEEMALRQHPALQQAAANTEVAAARANGATANYLPQVTATGQYQRATDNTVPRRPGNPPDFSGTTFNRYTLGATASQLIYDFGQTSGRIGAANANEDAAKSNEQALRFQILTTIRRAYFLARAQEQLAAVATYALANQEKHLQQIDRLVEQGMRPEIDRLNAQTAVANARVQVIATNNAYDLACTAFTQALGLPAIPGYAPGNDDIAALPEETKDTVSLVDLALSRRPEMAAFAQQRRAQEALLSAARGGYGPSLSAQANVSAGGAEWDHLIPNFWLGGLLSWPLFQGGATNAQVREAKANLALIQTHEDIFRLAIRIDVETAFLNLKAAAATLEAAGMAAQSARKQLQLAEARYAAGMGSIIELADAQSTATQAAAGEVNARSSLASARASLKGALGSP